MATKMCVRTLFHHVRYENIILFFLFLFFSFFLFFKKNSCIHLSYKHGSQHYEKILVIFSILRRHRGHTPFLLNVFLAQG